MQEGKLTLVATPIGNLADMSFRAVSTLKEVELILAEDTRTTKNLLQHYEIKTPLQAYHQHNEHQKVYQIVEKLRSGSHIAYVSDAGTPAISDPGYTLIDACIKHNIMLDLIPGPTAFVQALVLSGFPMHEFSFFGFPPHKKGRQTFFEKLLNERKTAIFYESTHRLEKSLETIKEKCPELEIAVAKELTKLHQQVWRGNAEALLAKAKTPSALKGEFVVVLNLSQYKPIP